MASPPPVPERIAVVGMAGRFPGANTVPEFWSNIRRGIDSITRYPADTSGYVAACGLLSNADCFDAEFFGYSPREAQVVDPQQRVFLEVAWHALEDAGCDFSSTDRVIGVFAGGGVTDYPLHIRANRDRLPGVSDWQIRLSTGPDMLPVRAAYKFDLRGPVIAVHSACSTSLVAIHLAIQSLLGGECDLALAGGATVHVPPKVPAYTPDSYMSPDGFCRAFDAAARGTVFGNAAAVVVLKRLEDAVVDGDRIYAVVLGSAVNNDGAGKLGFTAPSVEGQAEAMRQALQVAGADPASVSYIEAHGTGTPLGDPIEVGALQSAYGGAAERQATCWIGSVKTNIGHTDTAAGVVGLIKVAQALWHRELPASLHFSRPNPAIDFDSAGFAVNDRLREWTRRQDQPLRGAVNALGIGGTNAHAILEEWQTPKRPSPTRRAAAILLSAKSETGLDRSVERMIVAAADQTFAATDAAWTTQVRRHHHDRRAALIWESGSDSTPALAIRNTRVDRDRLVYAFAGHGGQYVRMGEQLAGEFQSFRKEWNACMALLEQFVPRGRAHLDELSYAQPLLLAFELALAKLLVELIGPPDCVVGHSLGAYAAATVAGVMDRDYALYLVRRRAELLQSLPPGAMLAVPLKEQDARAYESAGVSVAAINAPAQSVLAGTQAAMSEVEKLLAKNGVDSRRLNIPAAGHSPLVDPILPGFAALLGDHQLSKPSLTVLSETTAQYEQDRLHTREYWVDHMRRPVRFAAAIERLLSEHPSALIVEVGPGRVLSALIQQSGAWHDRHFATPALLGSAQREDSRLWAGLAQMWCAGARVHWERSYENQAPRVADLPPYPFAVTPYSVVSNDARTPASPDAERPEIASADGDEGAIGKMAKAFSDVLGTNVTHESNFFELGGDSLMGTQLAAYVTKALSVPCRLSDLYSAPTPRRLVEMLGLESTATATEGLAR